MNLDLRSFFFVGVSRVTKGKIPRTSSFNSDEHQIDCGSCYLNPKQFTECDIKEGKGLLMILELIYRRHLTDS